MHFSFVREVKLAEEAKDLVIGAPANFHSLVAVGDVDQAMFDQFVS